MVFIRGRWERTCRRSSVGRKRGYSGCSFGGLRESVKACQIEAVLDARGIKPKSRYCGLELEA